MHCRSSLVLSMGIGFLTVCAFGCSPSGGGLEGSGGNSSGGETSAGGTTGSGGKVETGGATGTGGKVGTGGTSSSGGTTVSGTGGSGAGGTSQSSGGATASGGRTGSGGANASGGAAGMANSGGQQGTGGVVASGGRTGTDGGVGSGGRADAGGAATGGSTGAPGKDPVPSAGCGTATTAKTGSGQTIKVGTTNRTYNLKIPDNYDMNKPYRLIIGYHWLNGTANNVTSENYYGLVSLSQNSTIFVAPQGVNNGWSNSGGSDVEFSRQLIAQLETQLCIDKSRIFCEGFSMGGSMSYAMASAAGELIRGVAVHSGGAMSGSTSGHNKPVAYFMTHGTKDSVCTWPGYGLPQLQDFAKVNGCTKPDPTQSASAFQSALPQPSSSQASCVDFTGCKDGYATRSCLFVGDHVWNPASWTPGETWKFFSQF